MHFSTVRQNHSNWIVYLKMGMFIRAKYEYWVEIWVLMWIVICSHGLLKHLRFFWRENIGSSEDVEMATLEGWQRKMTRKSQGRSCWEAEQQDYEYDISMSHDACKMHIYFVYFIVTFCSRIADFLQKCHRFALALL